MMNDITERFVEAYNLLLQDGQVDNAKDFAKKLGFSGSLMTEIQKNRTNIGITAIQNIVICFNINSDWILTGRGKAFNENNILNENQPPGICPNCLALNKTLIATEKALNHAESEIESKKEIISLLVEKNSNLEHAQGDGQKRKSA